MQSLKITGHASIFSLPVHCGVVTGSDFARKWHSREADRTAAHPHPNPSQIKPFNLSGGKRI